MIGQLSAVLGRSAWFHAWETQEPIGITHQSFDYIVGHAIWAAGRPSNLTTLPPKDGRELCPGKSQAIRGSLELENGGLRALGEAWKATFAWQLSCQAGLAAWCPWVVSRGVQGHWLEPGAFFGVGRSLELQNGSLRALGEAWKATFA